MRKSVLALAVGTALILSACSDEPANDATSTSGDSNVVATSTTTDIDASNPFYSESSLPYHAPDFTKIKVSDYMPAFKAGIAQHAKEIADIANNAEAPTFDNTIVAMEKGGKLLTRVSSVFFNLSASDGNEQLQKLQAELAPMLSQHEDDIMLNDKLFARVKAIYEQRDSLTENEAKRLVDVYYKKFVRAGAKLSDSDKAKIRDLNTEESKLTTEFHHHVVDVFEKGGVVVDDKAELAGLSDSKIASLAAAAKKHDQEGKYWIALVNTTTQPILQHLENRALRQRIWEASASRNTSGDVDNRQIITRLAALRAEKAKLLGFSTWADYVLDNQMAKTPKAVFKMLDSMAPAVVAKAKQEAADIQAAIKADGKDFELQPWDWAYYAEKVRKAKYDLDESQLSPYFELNNVMKNGLFFAMNKLYGITFKERPDLPVYEPDVKAFEVFNADGSSIGLFYADYYARDGKSGGAWMNAYIPQNGLMQDKPVIVNNLNITKPAAGEPTLLTYDEVQTMFHEFGHAVHGLFSDVKYPSLAGTSVPRDDVEFPSQFNEDWSINPIVLANYAKHYKTGEPIPQELLKKLLASRKFNQGFGTLEYMEAALLDMEWHTLPEGKTIAPKDVEQFEHDALAKHGVYMPVIPPRYKSDYFSHVFSGGYSAGYYAYLWSEVLAADAFTYMKDNGGLTRENGDAFRKDILSKGFTQDPEQLYIHFRGQEPTTDALLIRRGLK